ncbi:Hypothetical_protein [Hexamita inflata]|uniref:Hypothetical_protein n=1 Tax=Hexamita inflata TaxID=28002 RepID=A0AA86PAU1_9EUKA|nr:Hypothetical protein HINF_LOCUS20212 [Hexamita inflata]
MPFRSLTVKSAQELDALNLLESFVKQYMLPQNTIQPKVSPLKYPEHQLPQPQTSDPVTITSFPQEIRHFDVVVYRSIDVERKIARRTNLNVKNAVNIQRRLSEIDSEPEQKPVENKLECKIVECKTEQQNDLALKKELHQEEIKKQVLFNKKVVYTKHQGTQTVDTVDDFEVVDNFDVYQTYKNWYI